MRRAAASLLLLAVTTTVTACGGDQADDLHHEAEVMWTDADADTRAALCDVWKSDPDLSEAEGLIVSADAANAEDANAATSALADVLKEKCE